jgi:hypothetical protein
MRQLFLVLSILLLGLSWSVAQNSAGQATQGSTSPTASGGHMTVEGCLSGSAGNYTLTDKNGTTYQLTGDTAKLSEHVGHEVKITGMEETGAAGTASSAGSTSASAHQLQVTSVKHISKTCKSGGGGMSH